MVLGADPATQRIVSWIGKGDRAFFGADPADLHPVEVESDGELHRFRLVDLDSGQTYFYTVDDVTRQFVMPASDRGLAIAIFGDMQGTNRVSRLGTRSWHPLCLCST